MAKKFQIDISGTLLTSLISYYALEDVSDFYGSNNLTNNGSSFSSGKVGNAANFNGSSDLYLASVLSSSTTDVSMAFWVYLSSTNIRGCFFKNGNSAVNGWGAGVGDKYMHIDGNTGNDLIMTLEGVVHHTFGSFGGSGWKHVIITRDSTTWRGYVNNSLCAGTTNSNSSTPTSSFWLGRFRSSGATGLFNGLVDEFGFWNKVLSTQERSDLYNNGSGQTMQNIYISPFPAGRMI